MKDDLTEKEFEWLFANSEKIQNRDSYFVAFCSYQENGESVFKVIEVIDDANYKTLTVIWGTLGNGKITYYVSFADLQKVLECYNKVDLKELVVPF